MGGEDPSADPSSARLHLVSRAARSGVLATGTPGDLLWADCWPVVLGSRHPGALTGPGHLPSPDSLVQQTESGRTWARAPFLSHGPASCPISPAQSSRARLPPFSFTFRRLGVQPLIPTGPAPPWVSTAPRPPQRPSQSQSQTQTPAPRGNPHPTPLQINLLF